MMIARQGPLIALETYPGAWGILRYHKKYMCVIGGNLISRKDLLISKNAAIQFQI